MDPDPYGLDPNVMIDIGIIAMVAGIVGARLFHVIEYWNEFYAQGGNARIDQAMSELGAAVHLPDRENEQPKCRAQRGAFEQSVGGLVRVARADRDLALVTIPDGDRHVVEHR